MPEASTSSDGHMGDLCVLQTVDSGGKQVQEATRKRKTDAIAEAADTVVLQVSPLLRSCKLSMGCARRIS